MAQDRTLGFFDFNVTAVKTMDFLLRNGFEPQGVTITAVKKGKKFDGLTPEGKELEANEATRELDHHTIIDFFKQLFKFEGKPIGSALPYVADRDGFVLTVLTSGAEQRQVAEESLDSHGAYFIKEM